MSIDEIAFWIIVAGVALLCLSVVLQTWIDDVTIRIDPTESERWYDEKCRKDKQ